MKLSVIIVNYNVRYFLEQCLFSVLQALKDIDSEVIVVDNNSVDGSESMVRSKFPQVKLIANQHNAGYSKANNQGIAISKGEYILLLNPDTVVEESTFITSLSFMDSHSEAGALGPKMIDGTGRFLPESKRGLPTPEVAFYKIFGLTSLFPKSPKYGKYYLGHLPENETNAVDVLTGAFMLIRRYVLEKTGNLDENFFMYGEDIDLSYRISQAGYKNYYFPDTTIIHYKGESTKRGTINYVIVFYKAMKIFSAKHFTRKKAGLFSALINMAIYFRASLSLIKRWFINTLPVLTDVATFYVSLLIIVNVWEKFHFHTSAYYPNFYFLYVLPGYVAVWLISLLLFRAYRHPVKLIRVIQGIFTGTLAVLALYALLPTELRFSRAIILLGTGGILVIAILTRYLLQFTGIRHYKLYLKKSNRFAIVGNPDEVTRVRQILLQSGIQAGHIVLVFPSEQVFGEMYAGNITQLNEIIKMHFITEVIFCAKDVSSEVIIRTMKDMKATGLSFKIASPDSTSVIGSNSSKSAGDLYQIKIDPTDASN